MSSSARSPISAPSARSPSRCALSPAGRAATSARAQTVAVVSAGGRAVSLGDLLGPVFSAKADIMFGTDRFHPSATGYANVVSVLVPSIAAAIREPEEQETIATTMPLEHAAAVAELHVGTEVRREGGRAAVQRRRRQSRRGDVSHSRAR